MPSPYSLLIVGNQCKCNLRNKLNLAEIQCHYSSIIPRWMACARRVTIFKIVRNPGTAQLPLSTSSHKIVNLPSIPSLPDLISQLLIDQQGFDVEVGEHAARVTTASDNG